MNFKEGAQKPSFGWQKTLTSSNEGIGLVDPDGICQTVEVSHKMVLYRFNPVYKKLVIPMENTNSKNRPQNLIQIAI